MIGTEQWRAAIGLFIHRGVGRTKGSNIGTLLVNIQGSPTAILCFALLLICCGDVEQNPGPQPANRTSSRTNSKQTTLDDSLAATPTTPTPMMEVMIAIKEISAKFDTFDKRFSGLESALIDIRSSCTEMKGKIKELEVENLNLKTELEKCTFKQKQQDEKLDDLESRSRRSNIIVHGLHPEKEDETWDDCEKLIRTMISDKLGLDGRGIQIERSHRLRSGNRPGPVIVKFAFYKDKENVLRQRTKLKNTNLFLNEDFTTRVRTLRRHLTPIMRKLRDEGKRAVLVYDHLVVEGERLYYDPTTDQAIPPSQLQRGSPTFSPDPNPATRGLTSSSTK